MIKSVTVTNYTGDVLKMELTRPDLSGFVIEKITGLGPGKASINVTEVSTNDGGVFNSARKDPRPIAITLRFMPGHNIEELRQKTYKFFPIKKKLNLIFETDNRLATIDGYVESNEPDIFSKSEGSVISIICPDPHFYSVGRDGTNTTAFYGIEPMFEFPFGNESLTQPLLEFSRIMQFSEKNVEYNGDSEIGVTITLHASGTVENILIMNSGTNEVMRLDTGKITAITGQAFGNMDSIRICTVKGRKSIVLIRGGSEYNILNCLDKNSKWFSLSKGDNLFAFAADTGFTNLSILIENAIVYEGI